MRLLRFSFLLGVLIPLAGCSVFNPQVSRDDRDPLNEARAAVEISTGAREDVFNDQGVKIGEKAVKGYEGTFWSQAVADGNFDSTQEIKNDTPLEEVAAGIAAIGSRDELSANHVEVARMLRDFGIMVKDVKNVDAHQFTVTSMQDGANAAKATVAKYNNQRAAIAATNAEFGQTARLGMELFAPVTPGSIAAAGSKLAGAISGVAAKLGVSESSVVAAIEADPELAQKLVILSGETGYIDGTLTADQLKAAMRVMKELFDKAIEFNDDITDARATEEEGDSSGDALSDAIGQAIENALSAESEAAVATSVLSETENP